MKAYTSLNKAIALATSLSVCACGGGGGNNPPPAPPPPPPVSTYTVGGTVSGLTGALVLRNNGADDLSVSSDGPFTFKTALASAAAYAVTVATQPANQSCTVANGTSTVGNANVTNVAVTCLALANLAITDVSPTHGPAGTVVTLTGAGFSTTLSENVVTLNNMPCTVSSATSTQLQIVIPANAGSGNLQVTVLSQLAQSPMFTYDLSFSTVSTFAGSTLGYLDASGTLAQFKYPSGLAVSAAGVLYVSDEGNFRIRTVSPTAGVGTFAGSGIQGIKDGAGTGPVTGAQFGAPEGLALDAAGNLFVADALNNNIRAINPAGVVTTFVGGSAGLNHPAGMTFDSAGDLYVVDKVNHRILKIAPSGLATVFVGGTRGKADGTGSAAQFNLPQGITICGDGNMYVADEYNYLIRKITPAGVVTTYAGGTSGVSYVDGPALQARFLFPRWLSCDKQGKLFVVDTGNERIRMITPSGIVSTLAGDGQPGSTDGDGATARFSLPQDIAVNADGSLLIADSVNMRIRKIVWQ